MKKLYAFLASSTMLIMLVALGILGSEVANAQTYTSTSYVFHQVNTPDAQGLGSGPNWNPQSLTVDNSGELSTTLRITSMNFAARRICCLLISPSEPLSSSAEQIRSLLPAAVMWS